MSAHGDDGPAFPTESEGQTGASTWRHEGMTLLDWFSGHAPPCPNWWRQGDATTERLADWAFVYGRAMLKARKS